MPELPEVETIRRGLNRSVVGRRVDRVEVGRERVVRRTSRDDLIAGLSGVVINAAHRRGKYLLLPLDSGDQLMIHLRMSGQILAAPSGSTPPAHTHVRLFFDDGNELWFVDPRTFGEMVVFDPDMVMEQIPEIARLGVDPIVDEFDPGAFRHQLRSTRRPLKQLLLDQHVIAGIGNIYADEILHQARLRPNRPANSLNARAGRRLHDAVGSVLREAIASGGSTLADARYVNLMGRPGSYQHGHRVYGRAGIRCLTCKRGWIQRTVSGGRSTHFCPVCQR